MKATVVGAEMAEQEVLDFSVNSFLNVAQKFNFLVEATAEDDMCLERGPSEFGSTDA